MTLVVDESDWARSRMRVGLELNSDFRADHRFTVSGLHVLSWLNSLGGELRTIGRLGTVRSIESEWWQPLAAGSPWYASAALGYRAQTDDLYNSGRLVGRASFSANSLTLALGHTFGRNANLRVGVRRNVGEGELLLPVTEQSLVRFGERNVFAQFRYDTLENLAFPTQGGLVLAQWQSSPARASGRASLSSNLALGLRAFWFGEWGGHVYAEAAHSADGFAQQALGGFLRLSGASRDSINGGTVLFGRAVLARRIGRMPAGFGGAVRSGFSLELGNAFAQDEAIRAAKLRVAGSAFVSVDTRFGPAYLALGSSKGSSTVYVFLGPFW